MAKFYFTYGTSGQPFSGGWTEVEAPDQEAAMDAFRIFHPDKHSGLLNCAGIYSESYFKRSKMSAEGNFGAHCHETITLRRNAVHN